MKQEKILLLKHNCVFKEYGPEERKCIKCYYVIGSEDSTIENLQRMINNGYPIPDCGIVIK